MTKNSETHNVCNERLAREGGNARCCDCYKHEGCTLCDRAPDIGKTIETQIDWKKRFDDLTYEEYNDAIGDTFRMPIQLEENVEKVVKNFIHKELADARREVIDSIQHHLDFAKKETEMVDDPKDPKVRIKYFEKILTALREEETK